VVIETFYDPSKVVEPVISPAKLIVLAVCSLDYVEALPLREPVIVFAVILPLTVSDLLLVEIETANTLESVSYISILSSEPISICPALVPCLMYAHAPLC